MTVIFRPQAVEDVVEAVSWYEAQVPGLGEQPIDEILRAIHRAQENPELSRIVHRDGNVRRVRRRNALHPRGSSRSAPRSSMDGAIVGSFALVLADSVCSRMRKAQIGEWPEKSSSDETLRTKDITSL